MRLENFYRISPTTSTALLPICVHSWDDFRLDGITVIEPYKNDESLFKQLKRRKEDQFSSTARYVCKES